MKNTITILLLFVSAYGIGQEKIYFDKDWEKTSQENAVYYRIVQEKQDGLYKITDYYNNGIKQMDANVSDLKNDTFEGKVVWYDTKERKISSATYLHGKLDGIAIQYLKNGDVMITGEYVNDVAMNGIFKHIKDPEEWQSYTPDYDQDKQMYYEIENGNIIAELFYYINSNKIAQMKVTYKKGDIRKRWYFYDRSKKSIDEVSFTRKNNIKNGTIVIFYIENNEVLTLKQKRVYKNDTIVGKEITYKKNGELWFEGSYKDNEPYNGKFIINNLVVTYNNGILTKKTQYNITFNKILAEIEYKDKEAYQGVLYDYDCIKTYDKGIITKTKCYYDDDYKKIKFSEQRLKNNIKKIDWYNDKGKLLGTGNYKNGYIVDGLDIKDNIQTHYRENQFHGIKKEYSERDPNFLIRESLYQNDTIVWAKTTSPIRKNKILYMEYRNSLPFKGEIYIRVNNYYSNHYVYKNYVNGYVRSEIEYNLDYDSSYSDIAVIEEEEVVIEEEIEETTDTSISDTKPTKKKCFDFQYPAEKFKYSKPILCIGEKIEYLPNSFEKK